MQASHTYLTPSQRFAPLSCNLWDHTALILPRPLHPHSSSILPTSLILRHNVHTEHVLFVSSRAHSRRRHHLQRDLRPSGNWLPCQVMCPLLQNLCEWQQHQRRVRTNKEFEHQRAPTGFMKPGGRNSGMAPWGGG